MACRGEKYPLIYREKSHIFNLRLRVCLLLFNEEMFGQQKISAGFLTLEEEPLQKDKLDIITLAKEE